MEIVYLKNALTFCNDKLKVMVNKILDKKEKRAKLDNKEIKYVGLYYDKYNRNTYLISLDYDENDFTFSLKKFEIDSEGKLLFLKVKCNNIYNPEIYETALVKSTLEETVKSYNNRNDRNGDIIMIFIVG